MSDQALSGILDDALLVAALTCTRPGADPPTRAELDSQRAVR
jgi:fructokinase